MEVGLHCDNYGGLFVGESVVEVLDDYGAGPNHILSTGGTGRYTGVLSVFNFLRICTYMRIDNAKDDSQCMADDVNSHGTPGRARGARSSSGSKDSYQDTELQNCEGIIIALIDLSLFLLTISFNAK
jgi:hypothetical protein